jgi:hypothetical protein
MVADTQDVSHVHFSNCIIHDTPLEVDHPWWGKGKIRNKADSVVVVMRLLEPTRRNMNIHLNCFDDSSLSYFT